MTLSCLTVELFSSVRRLRYVINENEHTYISVNELRQWSPGLRRHAAI
jgi:hypothetical protein